MTKSNTTAAAAPASPSVSSSSKPNVLKKRSAGQRRERQTTKKCELTIESDKYQNVHYNKVTGRWQAWTNCMPGTSTGGVSRGPYCGEHTTENLGARAQDRALLKLKELATMPIKLNFPEEDYAEDEKLRIVLTNKEFLKLLALESRACYKKVGATKCLKTFMEEEEALGNLPVVSVENAKRTYKVTSLNDHLVSVLMKRPVEEIIKLTAELAKFAAEVTVNPPPEVTINPPAEVKWVEKRARSPRALSTLLRVLFPPTVRPIL